MVLCPFLSHEIRGVMRKWVKFLKCAALSFIIYMWFLGSSLLIKIDTESQLEVLFEQQYELQTKIWEEEVKNVSSYCIEKNNEENVDLNRTANISDSRNMSETIRAKHIVLHARMEKTVRDHLIYIPELKQMWCLVPKAASTSWSHKIVESLQTITPQLKRDLRNASVPVQVSLRKHYGNIGTRSLKRLLHSKKVTRILLVRHPFSRIVSAFEDKLKNRRAKPDSMFFYSHYGVKINRSFRKNRKWNKRKEPTFEEFIDYLIETDPLDYDEHWKPISLLCGVCRVPFNHIIKQEDLSKTMPYHLTKLGFLDLPAKHARRRKENKSTWEFRTVKEYFRNISNEKMMILYKKHEDDFNLFAS